MVAILPFFADLFRSYPCLSPFIGTCQEIGIGRE
jgi:hypothetical protein